jgi:hypothetical protein
MSEATSLARMSVIRSTEAHRDTRGEQFAAEISTRESQGGDAECTDVDVAPGSS